MANDLTPEQLRLILELEQKRKQTAESRLAASRAEATALKKQVDLLEKQGASERDISFARSQYRLADIEATESLIELNNKILADEEKLLEIAQQNNISKEKAIELTSKAIEAAKKKLEVDKEAAAAISQVESQVKSLTLALTGISDRWKDNLVGGFVLASQTGKGLEDAMVRAKKALDDTFNSANVLNSMMARVAQSTFLLAVEQDIAIAQFNKATSSAGEFSNQLVGIERNNVGLGVSTGDAAAAFGTLLQNVTSFAKTTPALQSELANTAARMSALGVSVELTARTMEEAMRLFGMTEVESMDLTNSLAAMAIQMNLPIEQVIQNFNAAIPVLAKFGKDAPDIFRKVQVASRSLGVEVGQLLNIMGQFDTFEGAATAAGKLNAILGGDLLNSTELLLADESERINLLRESIALSGRSFDSMSRFEKMAVANALGISDVSVAQKMLNGDIDAYGNALDATALSQQEIDQRIQAARPLMEKLADTFRMFAISMTPVVQGLHSIVNAIFQLNQATGNMLIPGLMLAGGAAALIAGMAGTGLAATAGVVGGAGALGAGALGLAGAAMAPGFQGGGTGITAPIARVHKGEGVVMNPPGSYNVITNRNIDKLSRMMSQPRAAAQQTQRQGDIQVVLNVDGRALGQATIKGIEKSGKYNVKALPYGAG